MTTATLNLRCVVIDDHPALLSVLTSFLSQRDYHVVATAADGRRAVEVVRDEQPDVVIVDYRLPHLQGPELLRELALVAPNARLLVYTAETAETLREDALGAGASGIVLKEAPLSDLGRAILSVAEGRIYLDPALAGFAISPRRPAHSLTRREADVLALLAEGLSHEEIGARLSISAETVRTHLRKACTRLDAATRTQAVAIALRLGLIS
jgi:DNA-binding NarL/FixJ family response regulator